MVPMYDAEVRKIELLQCMTDSSLLTLHVICNLVVLFVFGRIRFENCGSTQGYGVSNPEAQHDSLLGPNEKTIFPALNGENSP